MSAIISVDLFVPSDKNIIIHTYYLCPIIYNVIKQLIGSEGIRSYAVTQIMKRVYLLQTYYYSANNEDNNTPYPL